MGGRWKFDGVLIGVWYLRPSHCHSATSHHSRCANEDLHNSRVHRNNVSRDTCDRHIAILQLSTIQDAQVKTFTIREYIERM